MEIALLKSTGSVIVTYGAHYGISKFYNEFCLPNGIYGFLQGFINAGSPTCSTALKIMTASQDSYTTMITMGISSFFMDLLIKK